MKTLISSPQPPLYTSTSHPWKKNTPLTTLHPTASQSLNHRSRPKPTSHRPNAKAKGFGTAPPATKITDRTGNTTINNVEKADGDEIPQVVFERMIGRIVVSVGVPLATGLAVLKLFGVAKEQHLWDMPMWLPVLTAFFMFAVSALGLVYGALSTSWDVEKKGSLLGLEQVQENWVEMWREEEEAYVGHRRRRRRKSCSLDFCNNFMSILPVEAQGSDSSSSLAAPSLNPNSQHGQHLFSSSSLSQSPSHLFNNHFQTSLQISASHQSPTSISRSPTNSGALVSGAENSNRISQEVSELGTPSIGKISPDHNANAHRESPSGGRGGRSVHARGKPPGSRVSNPNQQTSGSVNSHGSSTPSGGRRSQLTSGNHLLNFHYDPISRPQPRAPPPRRQHKIKPYNKDLFLQANYKFVVLDSGNHTPESMDPDKMLRWEDIICVRYSTPSSVQCPICLEAPLCPQITSCGHIFCFPCILRYLLMGKEDEKGDCWKRCPLCFVMISPRDLYTITIENVMQYSIGDKVEFSLLTRQKDSYMLSQKKRRDKDISLELDCPAESYDPFAKFTFTSDVDLSVRKAIADLDGWLVKADAGLVDDLEKLPYVCAAMEHLEQRKKYWDEHRACDGSSCIYADTAVPLDGQENALSSSYDGSKGVQGSLKGSRDVKEKDAYSFYQVADGQHIILHPLNMKCLLHHFGSHDLLPDRICGKILQLETVTQSEAIRRRFRFLSHFSLTTTFQFCEIDLTELLPPDALQPFKDEIEKRKKQRKQVARKERKDKIRAEAPVEGPMPVFSHLEQSFRNVSPIFSMDDFEALGNSTPTSSSPPIVGDRKLFSSVTRLGFAAGHDSPALKIEENNSQHGSQVIGDSSGVTGPRNNAGTASFANIISRVESVEGLETRKMNDTGKKGKKPSRVLFSTAGGRRY